MYAAWIKPVLDRTMALILGLVLLPVGVLLALWIKADSKGPVLFVQTRVGKDGLLFRICKFRSMSTETPSDLSTESLGDPHRYVTRAGRMLRKLSLDELPQLWNILRGDMSFIGPRPALPNQHLLLEERIRRGAHRIKPGLTGLAQIRGRDYIPDPLKAEYDGEYAGRLSWSLDLEILAATVIQVAKSENVRG